MKSPALLAEIYCLPVAARVLVLTTYGELPGRVRSVEGRDLYAVRIGFPDWILVAGAALRRPMDAAADMQLTEAGSLTTHGPTGRCRRREAA